MVAHALAASCKVERLPDGQVRDVDVLLLHVGGCAVHHKFAELAAAVGHIPGHLHLQAILLP